MKCNFTTGFYADVKALCPHCGFLLEPAVSHLSTKTPGYQGVVAVVCANCSKAISAIPVERESR